MRRRTDLAHGPCKGAKKRPEAGQSLTSDRLFQRDAQTVIAWTLEQPGCSHALVGARNPDQAIANAKAGQVKLTEEELWMIRKAVDQTEL